MKGPVPLYKKLCRLVGFANPHCNILFYNNKQPQVIHFKGFVYIPYSMASYMGPLCCFASETIILYIQICYGLFIVLSSCKFSDSELVMSQTYGMGMPPYMRMAFSTGIKTTYL